MAIEAFDFLKKDGFTIVYAIALVLSIYRYRLYYDTILKYFPILIGYTFLTELLGYLVKKNENFQIVYLDGFSIENSIIYNIFDIILFIYFYFIYWKVLQANRSKLIIKYGGLLFIIATIINPFFQDFVLLPQNLALTVGSIILVLGIILYLRELKHRKKTVVTNRNILFWISIGLLIFYTFYPFVMTIGIYFGEIYSEFNIRQLHLALIALMYVCFTIGFIRMRRMKPIEENK